MSEDPDRTRALLRQREVRLPDTDGELDSEDTPPRPGRDATVRLRRRSQSRHKRVTAKLPRLRSEPDDEPEPHNGAPLADFEETVPNKRRRRTAPRAADDEPGPEVDREGERPAPPARRRAEAEDEPEVEAPPGIPAFHEEESEGIRAMVLNPLVAWAAAAALLLVVLVLVFTRGPGGLDSESLNRFYADLDASRFTEAESALEALALSSETDAALRRHLDRARRADARRHSKNANQLFRHKKYRKAVEAAKAAAAIVPDADMLFLRADSLRLLDDPESADAFKDFMVAFPEDPRRDDALFWRAEGLLAAGDRASARAIFEQIVALPKSKFKRSAARRLEEP